jgi:hypothetical protein
VLDFFDGVAKQTIPLPHSPDTGALRLKVTSVEGPFGKLAFQPDDTLRADGRADIVLTGDKTPKVVLRVAYSVRGRTAEVEVSTYYQLANQRRLTRFSPTRVQGLYANGEDLQRTKNNLAATLESLKGKNNPRTTTLRQRLDIVTAELAELESLKTLCDAAHRSAKLYFRQFIAADGGEIELTTAAKPPPSPESQPPG